MTVENISTYVLNRATTIEDDINIRIELLVARGDLIKQIPKINYERQEPMSGESSDILLLVLVTREEIPVPDEDAPTTHIFNSLLRSLSSNETDASESTTEENPTEAQHYPDQNEMVRQRTHWGGLISEKLRTAPNWTTQNGSGTRTEMHQYIEFEANDTVCVLYTTSRSFCSSEKVLQAKALFL